MFCKNCGIRIEEDAKFCKHCGAVAGEAADAALKKEPEGPAQIFPKHSRPSVAVQIVKAIIQIVILVLSLYWIWYMYNCAVGNYPNTGDQTCKATRQFFSTEGGKDGNGSGGCPPTGCGYNWFCSGTYYIDGAQKRVNGCVLTRPGEIYSSWTGDCRKCP